MNSIFKSSNPPVFDPKVDIKKEIAMKIAETEARIEMRVLLPFLYGWKWYKWAREFYESNNKISLLTAANQISKSSTQIRKCINWATDQNLWPSLWAHKPNQFWYFYPSFKQVNTEFDKKWKQFLPTGKMKEDEYYGWHEEKSGGNVTAIHFNSGVSIFFHSYEQQVSNLQSSTVDAMFCFDGNTPIETFDGFKNIKDISKEDVVFTSKGTSSVLNTVSRDANTIIRVLNNGIIIEATPDHYFKTERGEWIQYQDLKEEDILSSKKLSPKQLFISDFIMSDTQNRKKLGIVISEMVLDILQTNTCTEQYINNTLEKYQRDMLSITKTKMLQIMTLVIWNLYQELSILDCIKLKSGEIREILICIKNLHAKFVMQNSDLELARKKYQGPVLQNAEDCLMVKSLIATFVEKVISKEKIEEISQKTYVLSSATDERKNKVYCLKTNTGDFKLYNFIVKNCDEEMPIELYDELMFRLTSSNGYFNMVFTATLGQDYWRRCMEPGQNEKEECVGALKITASLYDSMYYEDGTPSKWTLERIKAVEARCSTHNEILKRVYGRFIVLGGRKYEAFDIKRHLKPKHTIPPSWLIYGGVDIGSGGKEGHPSAIVYVAVKPNFKEGRVFLGWRGDGIDTTAGDVVTKALQLKKENKFTCTQQFYDWSNKDFFNIAQSAGDPYEKAEKSHEIGEDVLNTLFKHDMMFIYEDEELLKLAGELATLLRNTPKKSAKDDFTDAFRYTVTKIPWDWTGLAEEYKEKVIEEELTPMQLEIKERRAAFDQGNQEEADRIDDEFSEWNDQYG